MLQLKNNTPFEATIAVFPNEKAVDTLYIVVKATFSINGKPEIAEKQVPIVMADEYWGEPGMSSLKYASEMHLTKPSTDIVMVGEACVPERKKVTSLDVLLSVGNIKKIIRIFGERQWIKTGMGLQMTPPVAFESMPLTFERAFGGVHNIDPEKNKVLYEERNPVGRGFRGKKNASEMDRTFLPNLEDPYHLINNPDDKPAPACFGFIAPAWEPRKSYAGTYDEQWQKKRAPYLPEDFNSKFFNTAHSDLISKEYLKGGEPVQILNMSSKGPLKFNIPQCEFDTQVRIAGNTEPLHLNLETILFEPNELKYSMIWRTQKECDKKVLKVEQIDINLNNLNVS